MNNPVRNVYDEMLKEQAKLLEERSNSISNDDFYRISNELSALGIRLEAFRRNNKIKSK